MCTLFVIHLHFLFFVCENRENIVHRDLKLENVMFVEQNQFDLKLIDFGFAEKINRSKLVSRAGTPGFLPPELFKLNPYTEKGDIFSLGVILYCLLVGTTPFKGETYKNVIENNKNCKVNYEVENLQKVSLEWMDCLKGMLAQDPINVRTWNKKLWSLFDSVSWASLWWFFKKTVKNLNHLREFWLFKIFMDLR